MFMLRRRLLMIGLDGFEPSIADAMIAEGRLPAIARLRAEGTLVALDHGHARTTGLAWEHFSTGLAPEASDRWASVNFDPVTYRVDQRGTRLTPFAAGIDCRTVVFDTPYFDLARVPGAAGLTNWGAHDPGVAAQSSPPGLAAEVASRFGPYPASEFIYGFVWNSPAKAQRMTKAMVAAVEKRAEIAEWLFAERCPDWELGIVVAGEAHSAIEALWHGLDPAHPLHGLPSSGPAKEGIEGVYLATDRMIARLMACFPEVDFAVFNYHGMGPNKSDTASMVLLPELLHRASFGKPFLREGRWDCLADGTPVIGEETNWSDAIIGLLPLAHLARSKLAAAAARLGIGGHGEHVPSLGWMPAAHYAQFWPRMAYFALPAYYTGQIRINLAGRESAGLVASGDFERCLDEVEALLRECTDPRTGAPAVTEIQRSSGDPQARASSRGDLNVVWSEQVLGLSHPRLGTIGPMPWRRTGGHTGGDGFAWFHGAGFRPGQIDRRSAFDMVPTAIELLGGQAEGLSGTSFAGQLKQADPVRA